MTNIFIYEYKYQMNCALLELLLVLIEKDMNIDNIITILGDIFFFKNTQGLFSAPRPRGRSCFNFNSKMHLGGCLLYFLSNQLPLLLHYTNKLDLDCFYVLFHFRCSALLALLICHSSTYILFYSVIVQNKA